MGHTNETANVELSQFLGTDKPAWLVDYNGDMAKIDAYAYTNRTKAVANENAITALGNRVTTVENDITNTIAPALTSAQNNITTLQGNITTINSLLGNGTPTTTDHTIIGAINEIHAINSVDVTPAWTSTGSIKANKSNNVVDVHIAITFPAGSVSASGDTIATLPAGFRPENRIYLPLLLTGSTFDSLLAIETDGSIKVYGSVTTATSFYADATYII